MVCLVSLFSLFGIFGILDFRKDFLEDLFGRKLAKMYGNTIEIQPWRLQNQALGPPKSSLEASQTLFFKLI